MKKQYTKSYKIKMVEKYKKSKIKISEFCRLNEIPVSTFNGWLLENKVDSNNITNFGKIGKRSTHYFVDRLQII